MAQALPVIAIVSSIAATGLSMYAGIQQGKMEQDAMEYQASVEEYNAQLARQSARSEAEQHREDVRRKISTQRAHMSAAGVDISDGSPLELFTDTAYRGEMDAQRILYQGEIQALARGQNAALARYQGKSSKKAGAWKAAGTLLTGASRTASVASASGWGSGGGDGGWSDLAGAAFTG